MRGPWHIKTIAPTEQDPKWHAEITDEEVSTTTSGEGSTMAEAVAQCRDEWSRVMHEDFGPADFVVHAAPVDVV